MVNSPITSTDIRLLLPETIFLEPEHFTQAKEMSYRVSNEAQQWENYLNSLALLGFEEWLSTRLPLSIKREQNNLQVGEFKISAIATENLLDEVVNIPQDAIDRPELATHFYVVLEVLEEQEEAILRGFLRYDELVDYHRKSTPILANGCYQFPLSLFDAEPNHLLFYCRFLSAATIPVAVASPASEKLSQYLKSTTTKLTQWFQGAFDETWQAIDTLINPEANLALSTRNTDTGTKRCKLIDLGLQLGNQTAALLVNITQEPEEKLCVLIQLHPTNGDKFLPPNMKLALLSKAGKTLQEVTSRSQDNYIQLKPFKGETGKRFSIEVSLENIGIKEDFEL